MDTFATENQYTSGLYAKHSLAFVRGQGALLWDEQGVEYLDCASGHGVANLGHAAVSGRQNFQFTNNPGKGSGSGGTCSGDSGGPAFWIDPDSGEETNIVMAVNSYTLTPNCNGTDYQFRTDIPEAQDFVDQWIDWTP